jgi:hypothetical protein
LSVGGFDPQLVAGEDYDLHNRIMATYTIGKIEPKEIHLGEPKSLAEVARKHYYYGKTLRVFLRKNKERGIKQVSPIRDAYTSNMRQFIEQPLMTAGFVVYQIVRYFSAVLGYAVSFFKGEDSTVKA